MLTSLNRSTLIATIVILSIAAIFFIYLPGAYGPFLLDDIGNLKGLSDVKSGDWSDLLLFLSSGVGPGGRPLSLVTFAFQVSSWPNPFPFKIFNIALHSINFVLVFILANQVVRWLHPEWTKKNRKLSFAVCWVVAMLWALTPIQVTTVEYVVQRMTILSCFWLLIGLNGWVYLTCFRATDDRALNPRSRILGVTLIYGVTLTFATLSKESGALLPLFVSVLWLYLGKGNDVGFKESLWYRFLLLAPILFYAFYFGIKSDYYFNKAYELREFSLNERLYTQLVIVHDYLNKLVFPWGKNFTLFYENFSVSRGVLLPINTLYSLLVLVGVAILALSVKNKLPMVGLGLALFLTGHLLESTALPLELYFEHRNYLPSLGIFLSIGGLLISLFHSKKWLLGAVLAIVLVPAHAIVTYSESEMWGKPIKQASRWYSYNPTSHRAHGHLAATLFREGHIHEAANFYSRTVDEFPFDVSKPLLWIELACISSEVDMVEASTLHTMAETAYYYHETVNVISALVSRVESERCSQNITPMLLNTIFILMGNDNYKVKMTDLNIAAAKLFFTLGRYEDSKELLIRALEQSKRLDITLGLAQVESKLGNYGLAQKLYLEVKQRCEKSIMKECLSLKNDMEAMSEQLRKIGTAKE